MKTLYALVIAIVMLSVSLVHAISTPHPFDPLHLIEPGEDPQGDAVGRLNRFNESGTSLGACTATLLADGLHVLTAAHCLDGVDLTQLQVEWETAQDVFEARSASLIAKHPAWEANPTNRIGHDLAVLRLDSQAPSSVARADILRNDSLVLTDVEFKRFGYGVGLVGSGGVLHGGGKLLGGANIWEEQFYTLFPTASTNVLGYDFDNGLPANDAFGGDLGLGDHEVSASGGDSGGPVFVTIDGSSLIAAVTQGGFNGTSTDINPNVFATFGDIGIDTKVSAPLNQLFIDLAVSHNRILGDINADGMINANDIDVLQAVSGQPSLPFWFDLNLDGNVDSHDVDLLVFDVFQTFRGDANLDGVVNAQDAGIVSGNFNSTGTWATGDFTGDGIVNFQDAGVLSGNFNNVRDTSVLMPGNFSFGFREVPEPASWISLLFLSTGGCLCLERKAVGFSRSKKSV